MDNELLAAAGGQVVSRGVQLRVALGILGVALVAATVIALQRPASAQISFNFSAIVCPILSSLLGAFGGFLSGIINALRTAFGCISVSGVFG